MHLLESTDLSITTNSGCHVDTPAYSVVTVSNKSAPFVVCAVVDTQPRLKAESVCEVRWGVKSNFTISITAGGLFLSLSLALWHSSSQHSTIFTHQEQKNRLFNSLITRFTGG